MPEPREKALRLQITINTTPPSDPAEWVSGVRAHGRIEFGRGRTWQAAVEDALARLGILDQVPVFELMAQADLLVPHPKVTPRGMIARLVTDHALTDDETLYALRYGRYLVERSKMIDPDAREAHFKCRPKAEDVRLSEKKAAWLREAVEGYMGEGRGNGGNG